MKILASDYDGTLRTEDVVSLQNVDAIRKFRQSGNAFGIVTGRSMESIRREIEKNQLEFDFIVANNGGIIYDPQSEKNKEYFMEFDKALELMEYIRTIRCASFSINDGYRRCRIAVDTSLIDYKFHNLNSTLSFDEILQTKKIAQIVISLHDADYAKTVSDHINQAYHGFVTAYMNVDCIDIVPYGISKASGLQFISEWKGYPKKDIYAIGDSYNDLSMIEEFHGFSVTHALMQIQQRAEMVVDEVSDAIAYLMQIS